MPSTTRKRPVDDVVAIKLQLAKAEDERLVRSWFTPGADAADGNSSAPDESKFEDELGGDDEGSGLGYVAPKTGLSDDRQSHTSNERLRKQLLGTSLGGKAKVSSRPPSGLQASKPKPQLKKALAVESDDDIGGRTSQATRKASKSTTSEQQDWPVKNQAKKRSANYLDELLAQRQSKKKKGQKD